MRGLLQGNWIRSNPIFLDIHIPQWYPKKSLRKLEFEFSIADQAQVDKYKSVISQMIIFSHSFEAGRTVPAMGKLRGNEDMGTILGPFEHRLTRGFCQYDQLFHRLQFFYLLTH